MTERNYIFDKCVDSRFRRNRRYCEFNRKLLLRKLLLQTTTTSTERLKAGLVLLTKGLSIVTRNR